MAGRTRITPEALLTAALTLMALLAMAAAVAADEPPLYELPALSTGVSLDRLDAVRAINDRNAMTASLKRQARSSEVRDLAILTAHRPREIARAFHSSYGPDSPLTRGATAIAAIIAITERSSQAPLDGISSVAASIGGKRGAFGLPSSATPRLRSRVTNKAIGIKLSSKW